MEKGPLYVNIFADIYLMWLSLLMKWVRSDPIGESNPLDLLTRLIKKILIR